MVFSTDYDLSYVYVQYKSEEVHGLFGLDWKNQEHTVIFVGQLQLGSLQLGQSHLKQSQIDPTYVKRTQLCFLIGSNTLAQVVSCF